MKKKEIVKKQKNLVALEHKRVQTAEGRRRAMLREQKIIKTKAA